VVVAVYCALRCVAARCCVVTDLCRCWAAVTLGITNIMYTPDERHIVTTGMDGSLRVWTHMFKQVWPRGACLLLVIQSVCLCEQGASSLFSSFSSFSSSSSSSPSLLWQCAGSAQAHCAVIAWQVRAIPDIFAYQRFNLVQTNPRPDWKYGAVTALDISLDSVRCLVSH
jgi:WD40 repeat protein